MGPSMGGEDITVPDPMSIEALESEKTRAEKSLKLSSDTSLHCLRIGKEKTGSKEAKVVSCQKFPRRRKSRVHLFKKEASMARAPGAAKPVVPPRTLK